MLVNATTDSAFMVGPCSWVFLLFVFAYVDAIFGLGMLLQRGVLHFSWERTQHSIFWKRKEGKGYNPRSWWFWTTCFISLCFAKLFCIYLLCAKDSILWTHSSWLIRHLNGEQKKLEVCINHTIAYSYTLGYAHFKLIGSQNFDSNRYLTQTEKSPDFDSLPCY